VRKPIILRTAYGIDADRSTAVWNGHGQLADHGYCRHENIDFWGVGSLRARGRYVGLL